MTRTVIVLGADKGPRQAAFSAACNAVLGAPPTAISYADFLSAPHRLSDALSPGSYLWIDSPHLDVTSIQALYTAGAQDAKAHGYPVLTPTQLDALKDGAIGSPAQFQFGLIAAITQASHIAKANGVHTSVTPQDIALTFDKTRCAAHLTAHGIPMPPVLGAPDSFAALTALMDTHSASRVFVKLRHGSAAAGMIALSRNGPDWRAVTTAQSLSNGQYSSTRAVRYLDDPKTIETMINALAPLGLHVERWLPKYGIGARRLDVRCVVVDGEAIFPVVRASRHPMTNLHLGGDRSTPDDLIARIGQPSWDNALASVRTAARALPTCKSVGIDLAILTGGAKHAILEINAFGDFVKDVRIDGLGPYEMILNTLGTKPAPQGHAA